MNEIFVSGFFLSQGDCLDDDLNVFRDNFYPFLVIYLSSAVAINIFRTLLSRMQNSFGEEKSVPGQLFTLSFELFKIANSTFIPTET